MKQWLFPFLSLLILAATGCTKSDDDPAAVIDLTHINKIITIAHPDSIEGTCKYMGFKILMTEIGNYSAQVDVNSPAPDLNCDGFNSILADPVTRLMMVMDERNPIGENDAWNSKNSLRLDYFAGRGEKFIGCRAALFSAGEYQYRYGWIKINVSADMDTVRIIDMASNVTTGQRILAGQDQ